MLIEFHVANFRSFREEQVFSMVADQSDEHRETHTFDSGSPRFGRLVASAAIYGANAAGKTNLLKALQFMQMVVVNSATSTPTGAATYTPFKFDLFTSSAPSRFEVTFADPDAGTQYNYSFSIDAERIYSEKLVQYRSRANLIFYRQYNKKSSQYDWDFGKIFKGNRGVWRDATRDNALYLSTAVQLNSTQLLPVFQWFQKRLVVIVGLAQFNNGLTLKLIDEPGGKERLLPFMRVADTGIADVRVRRETLKPNMVWAAQGVLPLFDANAPPNLEGPTVAKVAFSHLGSTKPVEIDLSDESNGTQKLFNTAGAWLNVFANGEVLLLDEIDASLHPLLVKFLIDKFHSPKTNPCRAQLICTTHNLSLLNREIFRRDQFWFVEKKEDYASKCYSLTEFSPRKDELIEKWYMRGRYGALPVLSAIDL